MNSENMEVDLVVGICIDCNKLPCAKSLIDTNRYIKRCERCRLAKNGTSNRSYKNCKVKHREEQNLIQERDQFRSNFHKIQYEKKSCEERLAIMKSRYDTLQNSYNQLHTEYANLLDASNTGNTIPVASTSASLRQEMIIDQKLDEIIKLFNDFIVNK